VLDRETIDFVAISRLQSAYADVVNRRAWAEFSSLFRPDAPIRIDTVTSPVVHLTGPDALGRFIGDAIARFEFFEFVILNTVVDVQDDIAMGRVFMCELRQERDSGRFTRAFGVYHDEYCRREDRWWFGARRYQSLARSGADPVFPFPEEMR
jgi:hypothetical protein